MKKLCLCLGAMAAFGLTGCGAGSGNARIAAAPLPDWRAIATDSDRARLRQWRTAWIQSLAKAAEAGHAAELAGEGVLLQPDAAIAWENPPPGRYDCRVIKIGGKTDTLLDYVAYPTFDCRVRIEEGVMSFAKLSGSQRPMGLFLPDAGRRMIFLGTLQLGDERLALQYGRDRERDMAGVVERIGEERWRLVFPYPHFESTLDVLEIVPTRDGP